MSSYHNLFPVYLIWNNIYQKLQRILAINCKYVLPTQNVKLLNNVVLCHILRFVQTKTAE